MEETTKYIHYARLIARFISGDLSDNELLELEQWKAQSTQNATLFDRIINDENRTSNHQKLGMVNTKAAWNIVRKETHSPKRISLNKLMRYAAIFLLLITSVASVYYIIQENKKLSQNQFANEITPGSPKAKLILADGDELNLEDEKNSILEEKGGILIENRDYTINYNDSSVINTIEENLIHTLEVPKGGEFSLILSDGSKIHLNSMTTLRYPVKLNDDYRVVELVKGEAFFEVAKEANRPFIVKTPNARLKILGTSFNVSSYEDNAQSFITLETGSLEVQNLVDVNDKVVLKPNQQAVIESDGLGLIAVNEVDASIYSSWRNGTFVFKDESLENIMQVLARWYNIEIFFESESMKAIQFSANMDKYSNIEPILELLQLTKKVKIETDRNYVLITKVNK